MRKTIRTIFALAAAVLVMPHAVSAVTISPPHFDYSLNPGDTVLDVIKVYNEDSAPIILYPIVQNFSYKEGDEQGTPDFYAASEDRDGTAMAKWVTVEASPVVIQPQQRANIPFSINVPAEKVQPGGHYGAVILSTAPPEQRDGSVGIGQQIAALVLVRVSGEVREVGSIAEFGFKDRRLWYNYLPVDFFVRFENAGNTHLRPTGNLFIKNMFGRQVAAIKVNEAFSSVLPLSIRRFNFGWQKAASAEGKSELWKELHNFAFGRYKATLVLNYGQMNQVVVEEREFSVWPWRLMSVAAVSVLVLAFAGTLLLRAYNRSIIRKYESRKGNP